MHLIRIKRTVTMKNSNKNNKFPSIFKYSFLYFEYLSKSKIVIIESKQYLQIKKKFMIFLEKEVFKHKFALNSYFSLLFKYIIFY